MSCIESFENRCVCLKNCIVPIPDMQQLLHEKADPGLILVVAYSNKLQTHHLWY